MRIKAWPFALIGCLVAVLGISGLVRGRSRTPEIGRAEGPDYPGAITLKSFEVNVNVRPMRLKVLHASDPPASVAGYYLDKLPGLGWKLKGEQSPVPDGGGNWGAGSDRVEITAAKGKLLFTVSVFRDEPSGGSYIFLRTEESGRPRYGFMPSRQAAERSHVPIYPGVKEVLLVEDGNPRGTSTLLFDTDASPEYVARYYRKKLGTTSTGLDRRSTQRDAWTCDTYHVHGMRVGLNLLRIADENRTSVLLVISRDGERRHASGVFSRWLAGSI